MLLTVSKRLEFSASRRLFVKEWSEAENLAAFGPETSARYGTGRNYVAYFIFSGNVDPTTGMLMNISEIKERVGRVLRDGFDHKFLNEDNKAFAAVPPTAENIARQLFLDAGAAFPRLQRRIGGVSSCRNQRSAARRSMRPALRNRITGSSFPRPAKRCRRASRPEENAKAVWCGCFALRPWTQLSGPVDFSKRAKRERRPIRALCRKFKIAWIRYEANSITRT